MTTDNMHGARRQPDAGQAWIIDMVESVPYWHSGDLLWPSVWDADATLDVCTVPADCGKAADGDDPRRRVRRINVDRRRGITVASFDQSACAGDIHYT